MDVLELWEGRERWREVGLFEVFCDQEGELREETRFFCFGWVLVFLFLLHNDLPSFSLFPYTSQCCSTLSYLPYDLNDLLSPFASLSPCVKTPLAQFLARDS